MRFNQTTVPTRITLDLVGGSYGVDRIHAEDPYDYAERIYDRFRNPDNTTYEGLVSRIGRKVGLMNFYPIEIDIKKIIGPISIDGIVVSALENTLTDSGQAWEDDEFVGKILQIAGVNYEIIENTSTTLYVNSLSLEDIVNTSVYPTYSIIDVNNPMVVITQSRVRLYSNFINGEISQIDFEMDIDKFTFLSEVVDAINNLSPSFSASVLPIRKYNYRSLLARNLIPQNSIFVETKQGLNSKVTKLNVNNLVDEGIVIRNGNVLVSKKNSIQSIQSSGDFYLDRFNGTIHSYNIISDASTIEYRYNKFPFRPKASLIIIDDIRDPEYNRMLFSQIPQDCYENIDGQFKNGKPLDQFFYDYHLLNKMNNIHWGK